MYGRSFHEPSCTPGVSSSGGRRWQKKKEKKYVANLAETAGPKGSPSPASPTCVILADIMSFMEKPSTFLTQGHELNRQRDAPGQRSDLLAFKQRQPGERLYILQQVPASTFDISEKTAKERGACAIVELTIPTIKLPHALLVQERNKEE